MSIYSRGKTQAGFTIIEVVVTLFILGVTLVLFQVTAHSVALNKYSRYKEVAVRIADQKMQTLRITPFASFPTSGTFSDSRMSLLPSGQGSITVTDINSTLKDVKVTVTWLNSKNTANQQIEVRTYVAQGGLGQ